jgi:hypothetical protein
LYSIIKKYYGVIMFIRVKDTVINTEQITSVYVYKDSKDFATSATKNYAIVNFSGDEREKLDFDSSDDLDKFLTHLQIKQIS